ncbi:hypothetical protein [Neobacillus niacini]|uniref:hypothetical protein n=1 Tax=Neobacillus niacini TaxID=86668 RepID=UPI0028675FFC|nr:hypothetical protein [Neobacillus niacini]MDR7002448.1 hypothetical protein [Neobacillus niacini]
MKNVQKKEKKQKYGERIKMFKKLSALVVTLVLVGNVSLFSTKAFAEENEVTQTQEMISTLDKYISADDNQFNVSNIPDNVYNEFGTENVNNLLDGVKDLNELAKDGEVIITDNETVYDTDDTSFDVQGGVNKIVWRWYGRQSFMSTSRANSFAYDCRQVSYGAMGVGAVAAYFSFGTTALFGGLTGIYFTKLADDVAMRNSGHTRGIIVNMTWSAAYWTERQ